MEVAKFENCFCRGSQRRCSVKKGVLRNFAKSIGKHLCQSLFFNKVAGLRPADVGVSYLATRRKIVTAPRSKGWSDLLLMIKLLFTVPVSNAKRERMFSKLKRVKIDFRCSLGTKRLENILRIMEEGIAVGKHLT